MLTFGAQRHTYRERLGELIALTERAEGAENTFGFAFVDVLADVEARLGAAKTVGDLRAIRADLEAEIAKGTAARDSDMGGYAARFLALWTLRSDP